MLTRITLYASILFLLRCSCSQNSEQFFASFTFHKNLDREKIDALIDQDYLDQTYKLIQTTRENKQTRGSQSKWSKALANSYQRADSVKFEFLTSFYKNQSLENGSLMKLEYLTKPSFNDLLAIYLNTSVAYNETRIQLFSLQDKKEYMSNKLIEYELENLSSTHSLLNRYYNHVFSNARNSRPPTNINFIELNLSEEEGSILFNHFISEYGEEIRENLETKDCQQILMAARLLPSFNQQHFSNFKAQKMKNFSLSAFERFTNYNYLDFDQNSRLKKTIKAYNACKEFD